jgi:hypothetical protein
VRLVLLGVLSTACGAAGMGVGEIETAPNAPWSMDGASTFLWQPATGNNGTAGSGALVISTAAFGCSVLNATAGAAGLAKKGSGLHFALSYSADRSADAQLPAWDGLFVTGGGTDRDDGTTRALDVQGWNRNGIYAIAGDGGGEAWLRVAEGRSSTFRGDFGTAWWSGSFDAKVCTGNAVDAESEDSGAADTGGG